MNPTGNTKTKRRSMSTTLGPCCARGYKRESDQHHSLVHVNKLALWKLTAVSTLQQARRPVRYDPRPLKERAIRDLLLTARFIRAQAIQPPEGGFLEKLRLRLIGIALSVALLP